MKKQYLTEELNRMKVLAGLIKESEGEDYEKVSREMQYGINPYQEQPDLTPEVGDKYTNVNVLNQDGTYEKRDVVVVSVYPKDREALVRTDAGGDAVVSFDDLNQMGETLEEGLKSWIAGGLIALSTLAGGIKAYQLDKEYADNEKIEMQYYNDVLSGHVDKMGKEDLATLGAEINDKTHDLTWGKQYSNEELNDILSNYASKYVKSHPKQFALDTQGNVQFTM